jgi:hypothetical protein
VTKGDRRPSHETLKDHHHRTACDRAQDYNGSRSRNEALPKNRGAVDDADLSKADAKRALDGGEEPTDGQGKARKSGNESSAIGTLR